MDLRTRFRIFARDSFCCQYCGRKAPDAVLEVDHKIPKASGGKDHHTNLVTACWECNRGKGSKTIESLKFKIAPDVSRWQNRSREFSYNKGFLPVKAWHTHAAPSICYGKVLEVVRTGAIMGSVCLLSTKTAHPLGGISCNYEIHKDGKILTKEKFYK